MGDGTRAGEEGMKIARYPRRIDEAVSRAAPDADEPVGIRNEAAAGDALVNLSAVAADSVQS
jgi:hypothetical protein